MIKDMGKISSSTICNFLSSVAGFLFFTISNGSGSCRRGRHARRDLVEGIGSPNGRKIQAQPASKSAWRGAVPVLSTLTVSYRYTSTGTLGASRTVQVQSLHTGELLGTGT